jgi:hypothetical protein
MIPELFELSAWDIIILELFEPSTHGHNDTRII